jgi:pilus assembly protein CpaC
MPRGAGTSGRRARWAVLAGCCWHVGRWTLLLFATAAIAGLTSTTGPIVARAQSAHSWRSEGEPVRRIVVTLYKSRTFRLEQPFATAVIGAPEIADVMPMSDHSLYVQGKKVGTTNLTVFDQNQKLVTIIDVEVAVDTGTLQEKIQASTGSRGIRVSSSNGQVILSGQAIDAVAAERAVALAKDFAPNGVINAMNVAHSQQVLLKVRYLEVSRTAARQLGVNWFASTLNGSRGISTGLGQPSSTTGVGIPIFQSTALTGTSAAPFGVLLANVVNGGSNLEVMLSALETQGLVRRLAEPDLMALSGDTAKFLAGGEFPVPIAATSANGLVTPTIEFKPFGVLLSFTPVVLSNGVINLRIAPEVSELDFSNAVTISGTTIPSLLKRNALTTVELRDGQSFAIAGLLQNEDTRNRSQIPWLGSVPVLGALFTSASYQKNDTDLVIIVTPHLVQPTPPGQKLASPLDQRLPSNDVDFFVNGQMDVPKDFSDYVTNNGKVEGPYGHMVPTKPDSVDPPSQQ